jgi:segregation and condensation protein A
MVERAIPWWRKALEFALGGIRSGFGLFPRSEKLEPVPQPIFSGHSIENRREDRVLTQPSRKVKTAVAASAIPAVRASAAEPAKIAGKGWDASKRAEKQAIKATNAAVAEAAHETVLEKVEAAKSEPEAKPVIEPDFATSPEALIEAPPEAIKEPEAVMETSPESAAERAPAPAVEQAAQARMPQEVAPKPASERVTVPVPAFPVGPKWPLKPQRSEEEKEAARLAARQKKLDEGSEESPFSVIVGQVYDGPLNLLLDLIRKQDIDIYDIPIAIITAQFLAYVDQLRASDVDVAGDFIYTASLLIHIKSKMLLPHTETGPEQAAEDPRRELVERLLEHERFKNAAQMLLEKQMLEAATWTNPGAREFKDDVSAEPEIAADTVDLVRIFRVILERARNRPVIDVEEDSVTVSQMIQFLARRLTLEDKPVALRRLLSHTQSEQALITMFLALLEMVRLQAILLRQDRQFSEIFIKKHSNFETVMNEGLGNARDDWR